MLINCWLRVKFSVGLCWLCRGKDSSLVWFSPVDKAAIKNCKGG